MKTRTTRFVKASLLCTALVIGGLAWAATDPFLLQTKNIVRDKEGNFYQVDSNKNAWVAVDGKNFNSEIFPADRPYTEKELEEMAIAWKQMREVEKIKTNIHFYEAVFRVTAPYKRQIIQTENKVVQEKWDPMYIKANHKKVTKGTEKRIALEKIIQDKKGNIYQVDSKGRIWVSVDGANWNGRVVE